jgi:hypothetical protein
MSLKQNDIFLTNLIDAFEEAGGNTDDIESHTMSPDIFDEVSERIRRLTHLRTTCSACGKEWMTGKPPKEYKWICPNCIDDFEKNQDEMALRDIYERRGEEWINGIIVSF